MAIKKRELTISEMLELRWNDGIYTDRDEDHLMQSFELGWDQLISDLKKIGHDKLLFDPERLFI
jgi:hypothetical protein